MKEFNLTEYLKNPSQKKIKEMICIMLLQSK